MRYFLITLLALFAVSTAWARAFPENGIQADLTGVEYPYVKLGGKQFHLAPGSRIFDTWNRIVLPTMLPAKAKSLYQLDIRGDVQNLWLLTDEEAALLAKSNKKKPQ